MWQTALTFWFTIVSLIGPGVCCCSVATAKPTEAAHPPKSAKSCCERLADPPQLPAEQKPEPAKKCPCERVKHEATAPTDEIAATGEIAAGSIWSLLDPSCDVGSNFAARPSPEPIGPSQSVPSAAGRTLLALYSTLRC